MLCIGPILRSILRMLGFMGNDFIASVSFIAKTFSSLHMTAVPFRLNYPALDDSNNCHGIDRLDFAMQLPILTFVYLVTEELVKHHHLQNT